MKIGVNGATGAMGQAVVDSASEREDVSVAFGIAADVADDGAVEEHESLSAPQGTGLPIYAPDNRNTALAEHDPAAVIDFSVPAATPPLAQACAELGVALVVGTTGLDAEEQEALEAASEEIPLLTATNFSRGIQALLRALGPVIEALPDYDVEILETHHNRKQDAPSGTAGTILNNIDDHRPVDPVSGRAGVAPREDDEVGVFARRAGDVCGEHEVMLAGNGEVLTLRHRVEDRAVFAAGGLDAAAWLVGREPGRYDFADVVGETTAPDQSGGDD